MRIGLALQALGVGCLMLAFFMVYGAWHALGVLGFGLLAIGDRAGRRVPR